MAVDGFASKLLHHLRLRDAVVVNDGLRIDVQPMELTRHGLEQRAASSPRPAENEEKLSTINDAVHTVEDSPLRFLAEAQVLTQAGRGGQPVTDSALHLQGVALPGDFQVLVRDAGLSCGDAFSAQEAHDVLEISTKIKRLVCRVHHRIRVGSIGDRSRPLLTAIGSHLVY